jgi:hypothetical protein
MNSPVAEGRTISSHQSSFSMVNIDGLRSMTFTILPPVPVLPPRSV